jgi:hypothetical protein
MPRSSSGSGQPVMGMAGWQQSNEGGQQGEEASNNSARKPPNSIIGGIGIAQHSPGPSREEGGGSGGGNSAGYSSHIFVALYDFNGVGDEKLSLKKGDQVRK